MQAGDFQDRGYQGGGADPQLERMVSKTRQRFRTLGRVGLIGALVL
ncbi:MAG: hypothetical protein ACRDYC_13460 [Acidimicrobiales bacterium]